MQTSSTIGFEDARNRKNLTPLILRHAIAIKQIDEFSFSYYTGDVAILIQYLDQLTFPRLSKSAKINNLTNTLTAVFVLKNHRLIGLAILNHQDLKNCVIECFNILSGYRNQGIGNLLLGVIEEMARLGNYANLSAIFRTYWKNAVVWEKMLVKKHWQAESSLMHYGIIDKPKLQQQTQWYKKATAVCPYEFLAANQENFQLLKRCLAHPKWKNKVPQSLNPFQLNHLLDEQTSFIVKKEDTIIGWMINHQLRKDLWQITTVFLLPEHRGAGSALFAEFLRRHKNRGQFNFMIEPQNRKMYLFAKRYFVPAGAKMYVQKKIRKQLI